MKIYVDKFCKKFSLELSLFLRSPKRPPVTVNLLPGRRESGNNSSRGFPRIYRPCVIEPSPLNTAIDPNIGLMKANSSSMGITTSVDIYACTSTSCKYTLPLYVSCSFHLDGLISILWPISKNIPTFFCSEAQPRFNYILQRKLS